jgi:hypothetical protein
MVDAGRGQQAFDGGAAPLHLGIVKTRIFGLVDRPQ